MGGVQYIGDPSNEVYLLKLQLAEDCTCLNSNIERLKDQETHINVRLLVADCFFNLMHNFCIKRCPALLSRVCLHEQMKYGRVRSGRYIAILGREALHVLDTDEMKFIFADRQLGYLHVIQKKLYKRQSIYD